MPNWIRGVALLLLLLPAAAGAAPAPQVAGLLAKVRAVGGNGSGNVEAGKAWKELAKLGPEALPAILAGMDGADPIATNWLRTAVDTIAEKTLASGRPLPAAELEKFLADKHHSPAARRLAYEWLKRVDKTAPARLLPGMLHDPSGEMRRDAVAVKLDAAQRLLKKGDKEGAAAAFRTALSGACDKDQVDGIAAGLKGLGQPVDLAAHFGLVRSWQLLAPFDNTGGAGFKAVYPPEKKVDLTASYKGKKGATARWVPHTTSDPYGTVDLNKALGKQMAVVGYAYAVIDSPATRPVEIRAGSFNALQIYLNGKKVFAREEYHHGAELDQYVGFGTLKAGRNELLVKVCQNNQRDSWAQNWGFQLRLCDAVGAAVPFRTITPGTGAGKGKAVKR